MGFARMGFARAHFNRSLLSPCIVSRGGSVLSPQPTMPDGSPLRCTIAEDTTQMRIDDAPRLQEQRRWIIFLPDGVDIRVADQIQALGAVYGVVQLGNPQTYSVQTLCYAYLLIDANGNIQYLRPNATVSIYRTTYNPSTKQTSAPVVVEGLSSVPVLIESILTTVTASGLAPMYALSMKWLPQYDIRDGDQVVGYNPGNSTKPVILTVDNAGFHEDLPGFSYWMARLTGDQRAGQSR